MTRIDYHAPIGYLDTDAQAQRVTTVGAGTVTPTNPTGAAERVTTVARYAVGPVGASAHGTHTITAGARSYSIAVLTAAGATPTLDGVALPAGWSGSLEADGANTLEAASLITATGDDVIYTEVR